MTHLAEEVPASRDSNGIFMVTACSFDLWAAKPHVVRGVNSHLPVCSELFDELVPHVQAKASEAATVIAGDLLARFPSEAVHEELSIIDVR